MNGPNSDLGGQSNIADNFCSRLAVDLPLLHEVTMQSRDISVWQMLGVGVGFVRNDIEQHCELAGFARAKDPNEAFLKTYHIAMKDYPELLQVTCSRD